MAKAAQAICAPPDPAYTGVESIPMTFEVVPESKCECGSAKLGVGRGEVGHSDWCPWSQANALKVECL